MVRLPGAKGDSGAKFGSVFALYMMDTPSPIAGAALHYRKLNSVNLDFSKKFNSFLLKFLNYVPSSPYLVARRPHHFPICLSAQRQRART